MMGPVPAGLSLEELSGVRAKLITGCGWGDLGKIRNGFAVRDTQLISCDKYDKVLLFILDLTIFRVERGISQQKYCVKQDNNLIPRLYHPPAYIFHSFTHI
jgi:hypothetical protein